MVLSAVYETGILVGWFWEGEGGARGECAGLVGEEGCGGSGSRGVRTVGMLVVGFVGVSCGWEASFRVVIVMGLAVRLIQEVPIIDTLGRLQIGVTFFPSPGTAERDSGDARKISVPMVEAQLQE